MLTTESLKAMAEMMKQQPKEQTEQGLKDNFLQLCAQYDTEAVTYTEGQGFIYYKDADAQGNRELVQIATNDAMTVFCGGIDLYGLFCMLDPQNPPTDEEIAAVQNSFLAVLNQKLTEENADYLAFLKKGERFLIREKGNDQKLKPVFCADIIHPVELLTALLSHI